MSVRIFRYPHGYYRGGLMKVRVMPSVTISSYEANNMIVKVYENDKTAKKQRREA